MRKSIGAIILFMALFTTTMGHAQTDGLGTWNVANLRVDVNKKWAAWTELQTRSYKIYHDFYYHEVKGGFQYTLNGTAAGLMGVGQYATYTPGGDFKSPVTTHEFRLWEQVMLTNNIDRLKIEHRFRVEQRWLTAGYRNRYRYRLSAVVPLNHKKVQAKTVFVNVFNEIFLTNTAPYFERNRLYLGAGYQFTPSFTLQFGFLNQFDYRANGSKFSKNYFQTNLFFTLHLKKDEPRREQHPGAVD
ncbi:MAG: DUF2490 domain-containing protein [Bacteroidota bacterium]